MSCRVECLYFIFIFHLNLHTDEVIYETGLCNKCIYIVSQSKRRKNGPFCFILGPPGPTQEMELMGPGGEGPSRFSRFPQSCRHSCPTLPYSEKVPIPTYSL